MVSKPHGQKLVDLSKGRISLGEAQKLPAVHLDYGEAVTIMNVAEGVFSPIEGPMGSADFESVLETMRLANDLPWTIPVMLRVSREEATALKPSRVVSLMYAGRIFATLSVDQVYGFDRERYCVKIFGTTDANHPGVRTILGADDLAVAGKIFLLSPVERKPERFTLSPKETRVLFQEKNWKTICAFQTRNAPHIGHEYLQKTALAFTEGVFINPVIGKKKPGDFKDEVILDAYEALLQNYYPRNSVVLSVLHYEMQYAGPREAIMHAIMRKNFGCTHIIIGRDHAGVGSYYKPYAAQEIFNEFPDLGITPLFFKEFFYCRKCEGLASEKICPHGEADRLTFSGTKLRSVFESGQRPPREFMRTEVSDAILRHEKPFVE